MLSTVTVILQHYVNCAHVHLKYYKTHPHKQNIVPITKKNIEH